LPFSLALYLLLVLLLVRSQSSLSGRSWLLILPFISAQLLICPKRAKLPSYLCLLIYVTKGEKASIRQPLIILSTKGA
jgi:hypothetical protein